MGNIFTIENLKFGGILEYKYMEINAGDITFIQGASGAGKSTLLKLLNASLSPEEGRILYMGKDIKEMDTIELRKEVILIGQNVYLFDETIRENFRMYYAYRDLSVPDDETITKYLKLCDADFSLD
ncbi:MAG TPA: ATP-binding cassette domain-containing protein, partial [Proteiniclasticum sp.]|nr:ATP-binding cassette domain-containing protein [Proteiniclasticum sp.]